MKEYKILAGEIKNIKVIFIEVRDLYYCNGTIERENEIGAILQNMGYIDSFKRWSATKGEPDLLAKRGNEELYIEIKINQDGLRKDQVKWFLENNNKKIILCFATENKLASSKT